MRPDSRHPRKACMWRGPADKPSLHDGRPGAQSAPKIKSANRVMQILTLNRPHPELEAS